MLILALVGDTTFILMELKIRYKETNQLIKMNTKQAIIRMNSFYSFDMAAWDKLYSTKLFKNIRFPEGRLSEDFFIMYKLFIEAKTICYIPMPLYYYYQRAGSISHNKKINFDFIDAAKQQMEDVVKIYPSLFNVLGTAYASANMTVYDMCIKQKINCQQKDLINMQKNVKQYFNCFKKNNSLPKEKIIQAYLFINHIKIYNFLFKLRNKK